nr:unnamed protein product [Digitaria exilis]
MPWGKGLLQGPGHVRSPTSIFHAWGASAERDDYRLALGAQARCAACSSAQLHEHIARPDIPAARARRLYLELRRSSHVVAESIRTGWPLWRKLSEMQPNKEGGNLTCRTITGPA